MAGVPLFMVAVLIIAFSLSGCAPSAPSPLADAHQVLRMPLVAYAHDIRTLDPAQVQENTAYVPVELVFPGLLTLDAYGNVQPWAAAGMPVFDGTTNTYTIKVRPGLTWSDGTPIDATTFAYSINRALNPCTASAVTYYLYPLKDAQAFSTETCTSSDTIQGKIQSLIGDSIAAPDEQTLVLTLTAPAPYFLQALTYPTTYAQPQQLIAQYGKDWINHLSDNGGFGGNLYKVKTWNHQGVLDLVRNDRFWGNKPRLREIDFTISPTPELAYGDFLNKQLDIGLPPQENYQEAKRRSDFHELPMLDIDYFALNWSKPPFNDLRARQAFALALDKTTLANTLLPGSVIPTNHIVPQGMSGYNPNLVGPDGTANLTGNQTLARQLLASYAHDNCGGKLSQCPPVTTPGGCIYSGPPLSPYEQTAAKMWQQVFPGYPVKIENIDFSCPLEPVFYVPPTASVYGSEWIADYPDPQDWLSLQFGANAINNIGNVNLPAANTLMAAGDTSLDPTARAGFYNQAEQLLVTQCAWIPLYQQKFFYEQPSYVHNLTFTALGTVPLASWQQIALYPH